MAKKKDSWMTKIGPWAFFIGLLLALLASFRGTIFWILGLLGIVVGLLNITDKEVKTYLLASITFLISVNTLSVTFTKLIDKVSLFGENMTMINTLLANIALFVAPGAAIVALKALYIVTKD